MEKVNYSAFSVAHWSYLRFLQGNILHLKDPSFIYLVKERLCKRQL